MLTGVVEYLGVLAYVSPPHNTRLLLICPPPTYQGLALPLAVLPSSKQWFHYPN